MCDKSFAHSDILKFTHFYMNIVYFVLTGALSGWAAGQLLRGTHFGWMGNIIIGVIGGVVGGWVFKFFGIEVDNDLGGSLITSIAGAVILLWAVSKAESGSKGKKKRR